MASRILASLSCFLWLQKVALAATYLNLSTTSAVNQSSTIECWQLASPFTTSKANGTQGTLTTSLGNLANGTYSIVAAGTNEGAHVAPAVQYWNILASALESVKLIWDVRYVMFLSGAAEVSVPGSSQHSFITSGLNGLFFAADTAAVSTTGHVTAFTELTILIQIPTAGGVVPAHRVLHSGPCRGEDLVGGVLEAGYEYSGRK